MIRNLTKILLLLMFFMPNLVVLAQDGGIKGNVFDETGPLPGVNVIVKGTSTGTITDLNGKYSINAKSGDILVFSFIGYETREITVADQTEIDVTMEAIAKDIDEVVVVGYGTQKKVNLTGAVASVDNEEITRVPTANTSELLSGKMPGLITLQGSGKPGDDATSLSIRGFGNPLVLIDGIEMSLNRIDPNEIESISILKDASAAIYGSRAGNGVILVTTKRGNDQKPEIEYKATMSFQQPTKLPEFVTSWEYAELLREAQMNYGEDTTYSAAEVELFRNGTDPDYPNANWRDAVFTDWTPMQNHSLTVRGGTDKIKYFMSLGFLDQESSFRSGDLDYKKYNVRTNTDAQITKSFSVGLDISYRREIRNEPGRSVHQIWTNLLRAQPTYPTELPNPDSAAASGFGTASPYAESDKDFSGFFNKHDEFLTGKIYMKYDLPFITGLSTKLDFSYFSKNHFEKKLSKIYEVWQYVYASNEYNYWGSGGANELNEYMTRETRIFPRLSVNYEKKIGKHAFKGLLLGEMIDESWNSLNANRKDILSYEVPYLFAGADEDKDNMDQASEKGRASIAGRLNYNFNEKYLFEATFRNDASHNFPENSRWGFFPSVSVGWRLSEETFIKDNLSFISNLKLRGSYSQTGYDKNAGSFDYLTGYEIIRKQAYLIGEETGRLLRTVGIPNPDITWEKMTSSNIGINAELWNGLLGVEFDAFYRIREDILATPTSQIPNTVGADMPKTNIESRDDRGIEALLSHRNKLGDFRYYVSFNLGYAVEKYIHKEEDVNEDDPDDIRINRKSGRRVNRSVGYVTDGIFMTQEEIDNHVIDQDQKGNTSLKPGDIIYKDLNNDSIIDWRDQDEIGYGKWPDLTYGLNINLEYKGVSLNALFQGAGMFNTNITHTARSMYSNMTTPFTYQYKYRWTPDPENPDVNINPDAKLPAASIGTNQNNGKKSDFWLQNNTYLRLKNLNINYVIPEKWTSKIGVQELKIFVSGTNLFTISKMGIFSKDFDPEISETQDGRKYPPLRTISFGASLKL